MSIFVVKNGGHFGGGKKREEFIWDNAALEN